MNEKDIVNLIKTDSWMIDILNTVKKLNLPDWWVGAGFVRSKVWDTLHNYTKRTPSPDIDVIYFDNFDFLKKEAKNELTSAEKTYQNKLKEIRPDINWSVTNQARMHVFHNDKPYKNSEEALSHWIETATCIGVKLDEADNVILATPRGIKDLVDLVLRPTSFSGEGLKLFNQRIKKKEWLKKWPKLRIVK